MGNFGNVPTKDLLATLLLPKENFKYETYN